jgi:hypothetical protein
VLISSGANAQPAFAVYGRPNDRSPWHGHAIQVLVLEPTGIAVVSQFMDTTLFSRFGLPLTALR